MTVSSLLSQARQGDCQAIAALINQQLQARGMTVQASRRGACLSLTVVAAQPPSQLPLLDYLERAFHQLQATGLAEVVVVCPVGGGSLAWQASIALVPPGSPLDPPPGESTAEQPLERRPKRRPKRQLPRPRQVVMQWAIAGLAGSLISLILVMLLFALLVPLFMGATGLGQLSSFGWVIVLVLQFIVGLPLAGLFIGHAQTLVLRRYLPQVGGWRLVTPLGILLGFFIAVITHSVSHGLLLSGGGAIAPWRGLLAWVCTTLGVSLGLGFLGLAQAAVLSQAGLRGHRWGLSTLVNGTVSWLLGLGLVVVLMDRLSFFQLEPGVVATVMGGTLGWLLFNLAMAVSLSRLLCSSAGQRSAPRPSRASRLAH